MCIFISCAMSQFCCSFIMCILQVCRNRQISGGMYLLHCLRYRFIAAVALRRCGNIGYCLSQNDLCLRHTYPFHRQRCIYRYHQCLWICISHIFRCTDHNPAGNKLNVFSGIQHLCQIIYGCIRIRTAHTFNKCGYGIIMIISCLIISHNPLLYTFGCNIQRDMDHSILTSWCGEDTQFHRIKRRSGISTGKVCQEMQGILLDHRMIASHSFFFILHRSQNQGLYFFL